MSDLILRVALSEPERDFLLIACGVVAPASSRSRPGADGLTAEGVLALRQRLEAANADVVTSSDTSVQSAEPLWSWWASLDEEHYTVGPCSNRDQIIEAGREDFDGRTFFIVEATKPDKRRLIPTAERIVCDALEAAADDGEFGEDGDFDLLGKPEDTATAFAEMDAAIAAWVDRWKRILPKPWKFSATRNAEAIVGGDTCGICEDIFVAGDRCLTDISLGAVHAACCGPERESYVDLETGDALAADAPIPTPWIWNADGTISPSEVAA